MTLAICSAKLTILVDNRAAPGLSAEHGFSALVELEGRRLMFDTGDGPALRHNAGELGVDPRAVDFLVLSHGHDDHTGGVPQVLESARDIGVFCHPAATRTRFSVHAGKAESIGMPAPAREALARLPASRLHWLTQPLEPFPGLGLTGPIPRGCAYEDTGGSFFLDEGGERGDPIEDDLALWIRTEEGLVVLTGCSHAGIINTLDCARQASGTSRIRAVIGGFHLHRADETRLERTVHALRALDPGQIVPCHCTGSAAVGRLEKAFGARVTPGAAGMAFGFGP
jgi:7,8-dihydropterin-6-yl-methyl-4-(beta-D-ribofuranosyl)aminobenzene 5'-phosphate synthase